MTDLEIRFAADDYQKKLNSAGSAGIAAEYGFIAGANWMLQKLKQCNVSGSLPLVEALDKYIELLVEELNETVSIAATHGWKSSRAEEGERQRNRIAELRRQ